MASSGKGRSSTRFAEKGNTREKISRVPQSHTDVLSSLYHN